MEIYSTAKIILTDKKGRILLLRRSKTHPTEGLKYDLAGGIVDPGEEPDVALVREIFEETGLSIDTSELTLLFIRTDVVENKIALRFVYTASISNIEPNIKLSWEHDQFVWLAPPEASKKLIKGKYTRDGLIFTIEHNLLQ